MRCIWFKLLLVMAFWAGTANNSVAQAIQLQNTATVSSIDNVAPIADFRAEAEQLRTRALTISTELEALRAKADVRGDLTLSELLTDTDNASELSQFAQKNEILIKLARHISDADAWYLAAGRLQDAGRYAEARYAAWYAYQHSDAPKARLAALDKLADTYMGSGDASAAIDVLEHAVSLDAAKHRKRRLDGLKARYMLRIVNVTVDVEAHTPTACLTFSATLQHPLPIKAEDYVRFEKPTDVAVSARDNSICIAGLKFGTSVPVTVLKGLPGREGGVLSDDVLRTLVVPNRKPRVLLGSGAYILPRIGGETLPLRSVNLDRVELKLYSVPDRGLVPFLKSGMDSEQLNEYRERQLDDNFGRLVWEGSVDVESQPNQEVTTLLPVAGMIEKYQPGLYALVARKPEGKKAARPEYWTRNATQWLLVSDLGLMSLMGTDGLHMYVNSLASAKPVSNIKLQLVAQNNRILAETESGPSGSSFFSPALMRGKGGDRPAVVIARSDGGDYAFLKLSGPALDLSDRGASGRAHKGPLDAFLYTERGIYRPGEPVFIAGLLRDTKANAVSSLQLTFVLYRPDGIEAHRQSISGDDLGGYQLEYKLSPSARTGHWRAVVFADDEQAPIGTTRFQVDDFVPERLTAKLSVPKNVMEAGKTLEAKIQADFLYGAPGADLSGTLQMILEPDSEPFENYKGYRFGLAQDEFRRERLDNVTFTTGASGEARINILAANLPDTSKPLRARLVAEVNDVGGRPVSDRLLVPLRNKSVNIGLKAKSSGVFGESEAAEFNLVALDKIGAPIARHDLKAIWVREHHSYSWYNRGNRWQYRSDVYDEVISEASLETEADGSLDLLRALGPGRYRLEIHDEIADAATSVRFNVGWWTSGTSPDVPDGLEVTLNDKHVSSGGSLAGFIKAPFSGTALITVVNDQILSNHTIQLEKAGSTFEVSVGENWGPGGYVLVTALRPNAGALSRLPVRATGLAWFSVDRKQRVHGLALDVPETTLPGTTVKIPVSLSAGGKAGMHRLMIAAVDEGILNITRFQLPNPAKHYFGKRNFALDIRDIYGRLIRTEEGSTGVLRTGGDEMRLAEMITVTGARKAGDNDNLASPVTRTTKTVALFTRDVQLDSNGKGVLSLDIPDFSGRLHLMAVAYGASSVGQGHAQLTVRTPVVADLVLPRFLAPGDTAHAVLSLQNLSGKKATVNAKFALDAAFITLDSTTDAIMLEEGERRDIPVMLSGIRPGDTKISLSVSGRGLAPIYRDWSISVRAAWPYSTNRQMQAVASGATVSLGAAALLDFIPGTIKQQLSVSSRPNLEAMRLMASLRDYAYWCSEQTVSKAYPSLQYAKLSKLYDLPIDKDTAANTVQSALARLIDRQKSNGSFGLWSWSGRSNEWLDIYITDFLVRAKEAGYFVADATIELALGNVKRHSNKYTGNDSHIGSYALYVLARVGEVSASQVRYFSDQYGKHIATPLGTAQMGAALHLVGERTVGTRYLELALKKARPTRYMHDYGSALRDTAAIAALVAEVLPDAEHMAALAEALESNIGEKTWLNTQEMSWITRAAAAFASDNQGDARLSFQLDKRTISADSGLWEANISGTDANRIIDISNDTDVPLRAIRTVRGIPATAPMASAEGISVRRQYFDLDGTPVTPTRIKQNDRLVVILEANITANAVHDPLIVDLLPAGLEVETTDVGKLEFVGQLTRPEFIDARDDRLVAAFEWNRRSRGRSNTIRTAYIVRAITPGDYVLPGTFAEDMYRPRYRAQGAATRIVVEK